MSTQRSEQDRAGIVAALLVVAAALAFLLYLYSEQSKCNARGGVYLRAAVGFQCAVMAGGK